MKAYGYNQLGEFIGEVDCQPNPLEWGEFIVPGNATMAKPPKAKAGNVRTWNGEKWVYVPLVSASVDAPVEDVSSEAVAPYADLSEIAE